MAGTPDPRRDDPTPSIPSPEQLDAAARELASGRLPVQGGAKRRPPSRRGVPSIEELDAAADELRSGRLPKQPSEAKAAAPKGGLRAKRPPAPPSIEALDAGAAELHSDRLPQIRPEDA